MNTESIKKALDHFENDEFMDAKEILQQEIHSRRNEFLKDKLDLSRPIEEADEGGIDWNGVKKALVDAAEDIHGSADMETIDGIINGIKKKGPKDTEDAVQIGINMMRS